MIDFSPRPAQERVLEYSGGPMGISAVPGSGKTFTLSLLAARLVARLASQGSQDTDSDNLTQNFHFVRSLSGFRGQAGERPDGKTARERSLAGCRFDSTAINGYGASTTSSPLIDPSPW